MHAIGKIPQGVEIPPLGALLKGRPKMWQGLAVHWSSTSEPIPVYLASFRMSDRSDGRNIFLFGARYNLSEVALDSVSLGTGYFVEYFVVYENPDDNWKLHRLLQQRSVTFSETGDVKDYLPADTVADPHGLSIHHPPRWESRNDAVWPTNHGKPMVFLGQTSLPETEVSRALFTWDVVIYLFWDPSNVETFKVLEQSCDAQTAERHYESES
jgi:hypothetical protein